MVTFQHIAVIAGVYCYWNHVLVIYMKMLPLADVAINFFRTG